MPVIVSKSSLKLASLVPGEKVLDDVLKNVQWEVKPTAAQIANGHHRRKAHAAHLALVAADIALATAHAAHIKSSAKSPDELAELAKAEAYRDERIHHHAASKDWLAEFYDLGMLFAHVRFRPSRALLTMHHRRVNARAVRPSFQEQ